MGQYIDIRIKADELPEGGFVAFAYELKPPGQESDNGSPIYGNTAGQVGAKIVKRIAVMLDKLLPEAEK